VTLYDHLLALTPTPVIALNRAVAVAELSGPRAALALVDPLPLDDYYLFHTERAPQRSPGAAPSAPPAVAQFASERELVIGGWSALPECQGLPDAVKRRFAR
jgi:hypothetical protein